MALCNAIPAPALLAVPGLGKAAVNFHVYGNVSLLGTRQGDRQANYDGQHVWPEAAQHAVPDMEERRRGRENAEDEGVEQLVHCSGTVDGLDCVGCPGAHVEVIQAHDLELDLLHELCSTCEVDVDP